MAAEAVDSGELELSLDSDSPLPNTPSNRPSSGRLAVAVPGAPAMPAVDEKGEAGADIERPAAQSVNGE